MPEVWFIRHGESISNANLVTTHPALSPLTAKGEWEATLIPRAFNGRKPSLLVSSPYLRAQQTAVPTLNHFAPIPHETWPVEEFTYLAPKRYDGTIGDERRPFAQAYWERNDPNEQEGGGGESFNHCLQRVHKTLTQLRGHDADFIAIFSHGLFVRLLLWAAMTNTYEASATAQSRASHFLRAVKLPNAVICVTHITPNGHFLFSNMKTDHLTL